MKEKSAKDMVNQFDRIENVWRSAKCPLFWDNRVDKAYAILKRYLRALQTHYARYNKYSTDAGPNGCYWIAEWERHFDSKTSRSVYAGY